MDVTTYLQGEWYDGLPLHELQHDAELISTALLTCRCLDSNTVVKLARQLRETNEAIAALSYAPY